MLKFIHGFIDKVLILGLVSESMLAVVEQLQFYKEKEVKICRVFPAIFTDMYDSYIAQQRAEEERINTFWQKVGETEEEILNLSEEEILNMFKTDDAETRATLYQTSQYICGIGMIK